MNVLLLSTYPKEDPSVRYRYLQYRDTLRSAGVKLTHKPFISSFLYSVKNKHKGLYVLLQLLLLDYFMMKRCLVMLFLPWWYDAVIVQREIVPFGPPFFERWLRFIRRRIIFDFDDALFAYPKDFLTAWRRFWFDPKHTEKTIKLADEVIAGNTYLAEYARQFSKHVTIIPTGVNVREYEAMAQKQQASVVVGWTGMWSNSKYLKLIKSALARAHEHADFTVKLVGGENIRSVSIPSVPVTYEVWKLERDLTAITSFAIGLMPLADTPWERGKCAFKIIQYFALGIPAIASPVGMNTEVIQEGVNGFLPRTEEEWASAIEKLVKDPDLRRRMGAAGRELVREKYSIDVLFPRILSILTSPRS